jgi:hypothetical protein
MTKLSTLLKPNKPTHIISYDLIDHETSATYKKLHEKIQSIGPWSKPLESFYMIQSETTCQSIIHSLKPFLDNDDKVIVINITNWVRVTYWITESELKMYPKKQVSITPPTIGKILSWIKPKILK